MSTKTVNNEKKKNLTPKLRFKGHIDEWNLNLYGDVYSFYTTNSLSREKLNYEGGSVKNIHYGDIHTKFSTQFDITKESVPFINADVELSRIQPECFCQEKDLVIADASEDYNDIGKTIELNNLNGEKVLAGLHTFLARPDKQEIVKGFGGYLVQSPSFRKQVKVIAQGTKVLSISTGRLSNLQLPIPSFPEQQKIASFLSAVDEKIQQLTRKKELLELYKKGVMQQLFTSSELGLEGLKDDRIGPAEKNPSIQKSRKSRFRQDNGKPYPKWEEKKLGNVLELQHGYQFRTSDFTRSGLAVIKIGNVIGNSLNLNDLSFISLDRYEEFQRFEIQEGDILMSLTGNIGRVVEVSQVPFKIIQNYRVGKFVPHDLRYLTKSFVKYLLISDMVFGRFNQLSNQSAQANFGKQDMDKITVQIPSLKEQQKIASFLTALDAKIESVAAQMVGTKNFKKGLLQQMFV